MGVAELRIKVLSLAAEARLIRRDEVKHRARARLFDRYPTWDGSYLDVTSKQGLLWMWLRDQPDGSGAEIAARQGASHRATFWSLRKHRVGVVRTEARTAHLALEFLRGRPYSDLEQPNTRKDPDWSAVNQTAQRFGADDEEAAAFLAWRKEAEVYLKRGREAARRAALARADRLALLRASEAVAPDPLAGNG